jgi:UDP-glucose 4-epimerase
VRVLVTGGAGYIGSHFVKDVLSGGHTPVVYDNLSMGHKWAVLTDRFYRAELSDTRTIEDVLKKEAIDAVVHFASNILVGESVAEPMKYFRNNYVNTLNLLDSTVRCGVKRFIHSSTAAVYGMPRGVPIKEEAPRHPINPYGLTKYFVEETLNAYEHAYGIKYVSLRYFNAAGADPGLQSGEAHDPETHLIPRVLEAALGTREHVDIYGTDYPTPDGTCIRDYIHVSDLAHAHTLALDYLSKEGKSGAFNLGNSKGYSVKEVIRTAEEVTGRKIPARASGRRAGDPPVLVADSSRAREVLGWKPEFEELHTILLHAWKWMRKAHEEGHMRKRA